MGSGGGEHWARAEEGWWSETALASWNPLAWGAVVLAAPAWREV